MQTAFMLGEHRIDPGANQISGPLETRKVEPKVMAVLCVLAANAGQTVSREALLAQVWPGRVVVEETLTRAVSQLRLALGDSKGQARMIQTVPKQGYRLLLSPHPISPQAGEPAGSVSDQRAPGRWPAWLAWLIAALLAALLTWLVLHHGRNDGLNNTRVDNSAHIDSRQSSVAVLPFRNLSADADAEYFAAGIAEELLNALAGVPGLRVPSPRSSFAMRDNKLGTQAIARALSVNHLLEGSVRRSGNTLRVSAQLVDVNSDSTVWSQQYDRNVGDVIAVQEAIAGAVVQALPGVLQQDTALAVSHTNNLQAYSYYLQGHYWWMNGNNSSWFVKARDAFEAAVKLDPNFAEAQASLAYIYARANFFAHNMPADEARRRAQAAIDQALTLKPTAVNAHIARAVLAANGAQFSLAREHLRTALGINPNSSTAYFLLSEVELASAQTEQALAAARQALSLDPLSPWVNISLAQVLFASGQLEAALQRVQHAATLNPEYSWTYVWLARIHRARGDFEAATKAIEKANELDSTAPGNAVLAALLHLDNEDTRAAKQWLTVAASLLGNSDAARFWQQFDNLAVNQSNPAVAAALLHTMPHLHSSSYNLVTLYHAAQLAVGEAGKAIQKLTALYPELLRVEPVITLDNLAAAIALVQLLEPTRPQQAQRLLSAGMALTDTLPSIPDSRSHSAQLLALAGRHDDALSNLSRQSATGQLVERWQLPLAPAFSELLEHAGFQALLVEPR